MTMRCERYRGLGAWWGVIGVPRVVLIALCVAVVVGALGVLALRWGVRRMARSVGVRRRLFLVRSHLLPPGPRRDTATLRARLDFELSATRSMLESAPQGLVFRADAAGILNELVTAATDIDRELGAIELFLDPSQQRAALTAIAAQVNQLIDTTYTARHTILRTSVEDRERRLASLQADVAKQADALERYRREDRERGI